METIIPYKIHKQPQANIQANMRVNIDVSRLSKFQNNVKWCLLRRAIHSSFSKAKKNYFSRRRLLSRNCNLKEIFSNYRYRKPKQMNKTSFSHHHTVLQYMHSCQYLPTLFYHGENRISTHKINSGNQKQ